VVAVHSYELALTWTGNRGTGTSEFRSYSRAHALTAPGRPPLLGSADRAFRGDADRWNPELLLLAALASCHFMSFLHVCVQAGVVVNGYADAPIGQLTQTRRGGGRFTEVVLRPRVRVASKEQIEPATALHVQANELCFIASSVNFPVRHEPVTLVGV
jgi:organic hydroperoxide reductase OsmC/OhrA